MRFYYVRLWCDTCHESTAHRRYGTLEEVSCKVECTAHRSLEGHPPPDWCDLALQAARVMNTRQDLLIGVS